MDNKFQNNGENNASIFERNQKEIEAIIRNALAEDIGKGDVTTDCIVPSGMIFTGQFITKENGVLAGLPVAQKTFQLLNGYISFHTNFKDGDFVKKETIFAEIEGDVRTILKGERVALNFLQRMSGIATLTRQFVNAIKHTDCIILDTRKTVPGLRLLDKLAVVLGGGQNHRFGLYDMALIKENHITVAGSIKEAVQRVRTGDPEKRKIEVEVKNLEELQEALSLDVDRIMLDNMTVTEIKKAVEMVAGKIPLEASGNITLENVKEIAEAGVNYISIGKLTHSVKALDISLILKKKDIINSF